MILNRRQAMAASLASATSVGACFLTQSGQAAEGAADERAKRLEIPVLVGESKEVIHAHPEKPGEKGWYTNDHCFLEDKSGRLHWFGINNPFPPEGKELYRYHPNLGHFSTTDPLGEWERHDWALDESEGTEYLGAPFVIWSEEIGRYVMVLETMLENTRRLEVSYSDNLETWERTHQPILPDLLWISSRDPQILKRDNGEYWIIITTHNVRGIKQSQVVKIVTQDFVKFEEPEIILGIDDCSWATLIESPFLVERGDYSYLFFTYAHRRYAETLVVASKSSSSFDFTNNCLTTLFGHAAEIFEYQGKQFISSCGPEDSHYLNRHSVTITELRWLPYEGNLNE